LPKKRDALRLLLAEMRWLAKKGLQHKNGLLDVD
jgi:hypothetical protein